MGRSHESQSQRTASQAAGDALTVPQTQSKGQRREAMRCGARIRDRLLQAQGRVKDPLFADDAIQAVTSRTTVIPEGRREDRCSLSRVKSENSRLQTGSAAHRQHEKAAESNQEVQNNSPVQALQSKAQRRAAMRYKPGIKNRLLRASVKRESSDEVPRLDEAVPGTQAQFTSRTTEGRKEERGNLSRVSSDNSHSHSDKLQTGSAVQKTAESNQEVRQSNSPVHHKHQAPKSKAHSLPTIQERRGDFQDTENRSGDLMDRDESEPGEHAKNISNQEEVLENARSMDRVSGILKDRSRSDETVADYHSMGMDGESVSVPFSVIDGVNGSEARHAIQSDPKLAAAAQVHLSDEKQTHDDGKDRQIHLPTQNDMDLRGQQSTSASSETDIKNQSSPDSSERLGSG